MDRLVVLLSGDVAIKLLGVPKLQNGTGEAEATAMFNLVQFIQHQLVQFHLRDDYRELLQLSLVFLRTDSGSFVHNHTCGSAISAQRNDLKLVRLQGHKCINFQGCN